MVIKPNGCPILISQRWDGPNNPNNLIAYPMETVTHDTGNKNAGANAPMHWRFVVNGGGSDRVSFTLTVDDSMSIQILPFGQANWANSDGYNGVHNRRGPAIETCVNKDGNYARMLGHHVWLLALIKQAPEIFDWYNEFRTRQHMRNMRQIADNWHQKTAPDGKYCPATALNAHIVPAPMLTTDNAITVALPVLSPTLKVYSRAGDKVIRCNAIGNEDREIPTAGKPIEIEPLNLIRFRSKLAITTLYGTIIPLNIIRFSGLFMEGDKTEYTDKTAVKLLSKIPSAHAVRGRYVLHLNTGV